MFFKTAWLRDGCCILDIETQVYFYYTDKSLMEISLLIMRFLQDSQRGIAFRKRQLGSSLLLFFSLSAMLSTSYAQTEWLLFADLSVNKRNLPPSLSAQMEELSIKPSVTLFGTTDKKYFKTLFEGVLQGDKGEFERLQIGWKINQMNTLWAGRFHNPADSWTRKFNHGLYFQTAQSRPGIVEFEDEGGIMPIHLSGLLFEGFYITQSGGGFRYSAVLADGPRVVTNKQGFSELREPSSYIPILMKGNINNPAYSASVSYLPDASGETEIGFFVSHNKIPEKIAPIFGDLVQTSAGLTGTWEEAPYKVFGAAIAIRQEMRMSDVSQMAHVIQNQYLQGEYLVRHDLTAYSRVEFTQGSGDDAYINSFAMFITNRYVLGFRQELNRNHAVKLEVSRAEHQMKNTRFDSVSLQWNMIYP